MFHEFEIESLKEAFPSDPINLEDDFDSFEIEGIYALHSLNHYCFKPYRSTRFK